MVLQAMDEAGAAPKTTTVIGDTSFDMAMAAAAGTRGIGVDWGYHHADELLAAGAMAVAKRPIDILELVKERADG